jgi:hypothetical protein
MLVRDMILALLEAPADMPVYVAGTDARIAKIETTTRGHFIDLVPDVGLSEDPTRSAMELFALRQKYDDEVVKLRDQAQALLDGVGSLEIIARRLERKTAE